MTGHRLPVAEHRAEMLAAMQRQVDDDNAQRHAELLVRDATESVEGREAWWTETMAAMPAWARDVHWDSGPG